MSEGRQSIRPVEDKAMTAGKVTSVNTPPFAHLKELLVEVTGELNVTAVVTLAEDAPENILQRIELRGAGQIEPYDASGREAFQLDTADFWKLPKNSAPATGVGVNSFTSVYRIPVERRNSASPEETYLSPRSVRNLNLKLTAAVVGDLITAGTATLQNLSVKVTAVEAEDIPDGVRDNSRHFSQQFIISGSGPTRLNMPVGQEITRLMITARSAGLRSDAIITNVKIDANQKLPLYESTWNELRRITSDDHHWTPATDIEMLGVGIVDFDDEQEGNSIDTRGLEEIGVIVTTTGAATIEVLLQEILRNAPIEAATA